MKRLFWFLGGVLCMYTCFQGISLIRYAFESMAPVTVGHVMFAAVSLTGTAMSLLYCFWKAFFCK